jgi:hypothetical protein
MESAFAWWTGMMEGGAVGHPRIPTVADLAMADIGDIDQSLVILLFCHADEHNPFYKMLFLPAIVAVTPNHKKDRESKIQFSSLVFMIKARFF